MGASDPSEEFRIEDFCAWIYLAWMIYARYVCIPEKESLYNKNSLTRFGTSGTPFSSYGLNGFLPNWDLLFKNLKSMPKVLNYIFSCFYANGESNEAVCDSQFLPICRRHSGV